MIVAYAMWILAALLLIVGQLAGDLHHSVAEERQSTEFAALRAAAISGLNAYRFILIERAGREFSHRQEPFRADPAFCAFETADGIRTISYHARESAYVGLAEPHFGAVDEESRINMARVDASIVARLPGVTQAMATNLVAYAQSTTLQPLQSLAALRAVPGWEFIDLEQLTDLVTFHGEGQVNVNTASTEVLRLLGMSERAIVDLNRFLDGTNGQRGDDDDRFFKGVSEIALRLSEHGVSPKVVAEWTRAVDQRLITTRSEYYRVRARSIQESSGRQYEVDAIIRVDDDGTILTWREYQPA